MFCGSSSGLRPEYRETALHVGRYLALQGIGVVYGGGRVGLMGAVADGALAAGGEVIGVIPEMLMRKEIGHTNLTELRVVSDLHQRKAMMADLSDGFIALPGGYGTFEEFCEVITWSQLSLHQKPCGLLNVAGYWDPLAQMFDHAVEEGFLRPENRKIVLMDDDFEALLKRMSEWKPSKVEKWIGKAER